MAKALNATLDSIDSRLLEAELPGARTALDRTEMRSHLQTALLESRQSGAVTRCDVTAAVLDGDRLAVRYLIEVEDAGMSRSVLVTGRVFPDGRQAAAYLVERLAPLVDGRTSADTSSLTLPVALVEPLGMTVSVFPFDGELPTLSAATDQRVVVPVLQRMLATAHGPDVRVVSCRVEPAHYNRRHRCMLRYHLGLAGAARELTLYGKVADDGSGARIPDVVQALRAPLAAAGVAVPECLGYHEDLHLVVFREIAGAPSVARLLKDRLRGDPSPDGLTLEAAVEACGRIAAHLHTSGLRLGARRSLPVELAALRAGLSPTRRLSPVLADQVDRSLDQAEGVAQRTPPLDLAQCHGDFSYTQLIFDGPAAGLVDFDNVCQAEPALDLGQFLAYLRYSGLKSDRVTGRESTQLTEQLAQRFVAAYVAAGGRPAAPNRVAVYETTNLVRMATHAWENLKGGRLEHIVSLLGRGLPSES
ncbi:MAG: phosphotransferase [Actinomycetes bacterium]